MERFMNSCSAVNLASISEISVECSSILESAETACAHRQLVSSKIIVEHNPQTCVQNGPQTCVQYGQQTHKKL